MVWTLLINHSEAGVCVCVCVRWLGVGRSEGGCWKSQSHTPTYRWPALLAGCQPRVSWSMLVKRTLIWVWQGNQQPNSTVKLNSVVEHRSASFMLRLQKGKVPQHQFVTEMRHRARTLHKTQRGRESGAGSVCACVFVCGQDSVLTTFTSLPATDNSRERDGFTSVVWVGCRMEGEEKADRERGRRGVGLLQAPWTKKGCDSRAAGSLFSF